MKKTPIKIILHKWHIFDHEKSVTYIKHVFNVFKVITASCIITLTHEMTINKRFNTKCDDLYSEISTEFRSITIIFV